MTEQAKTQDEGIDDKVVALISAISSYVEGGVVTPSPVVELLKSSRPSAWSAAGRAELMRNER